MYIHCLPEYNDAPTAEFIPRRCFTDCKPLQHFNESGTMDWDYDGTNTFGAVVTLTCTGTLVTAGDFVSVQTVVCDRGGWNDTAVKQCTGE